MKSIPKRRERGVTLIVGLIMLVLITLMVTTAFTLSTTNLKSVGNMQFRDESIAAANKGIEQMVGTYFGASMSSVPPAQTITFDINNDGTTDYSVGIAAPVCTQATKILALSVIPCNPELTPLLCPKDNFSTLWDIEATVTDAVSGSSMRIHQGVRKELTQLQCNAACPPPAGGVCS
jgi:hypothetical protein